MSRSSSNTIPVRIDWDKTIAVSKTTATLMHMVHPISRKGRPMHDQALDALKALDARHVRYMNWHVYPRLAVAALHPPTKEKTFWDFSLMDAELLPFLEATKGREPVPRKCARPAAVFAHGPSAAARRSCSRARVPVRALLIASHPCRARAGVVRWGQPSVAILMATFSRCRRFRSNTCPVGRPSKLGIRTTAIQNLIKF
jgi:hypothetical protein